MSVHVSLGIVRGRHEMPVIDYIFDTIDDVLDFKALEDMAYMRLDAMFPTTIRGYVNTRANTGIIGTRRDGSLDLYVAGLTAATIAVINAAYNLGIVVRLLHYDKKSKRYFAQETPSAFYEM